ncbi:MAG TPA: HAD family hydrolase [Actinophytocola sp.]|nr:HAD family hydrolase [Actinophytocola sp.]
MATPGTATPVAVLFDRDGTLVEDVPYNADPALVTPVPGARGALDLLRSKKIRVGVVTNQSGVGRGLFSEHELSRVHARLAELLGPFDDWRYCPHLPADGCACRKPRPGMVLAACAALGVRPERCVVVGDIGADIDAARAAGAWSVLVPTTATRQAEVERAPLVAPDVWAAAELAAGLLGRRS